jgi:hypothetical protein
MNHGFKGTVSYVNSQNHVLDAQESIAKQNPHPKTKQRLPKTKFAGLIQRKWPMVGWRLSIPSMSRWIFQSWWAS